MQAGIGRAPRRSRIVRRRDGLNLVGGQFQDGAVRARPINDVPSEIVPTRFATGVRWYRPVAKVPERYAETASSDIRDHFSGSGRTMLIVDNSQCIAFGGHSKYGAQEIPPISGIYPTGPEY